MLIGLYKIVVSLCLGFLYIYFHIYFSIFIFCFKIHIIGIIKIIVNSCDNENGNFYLFAVVNSVSTINHPTTLVKSLFLTNVQFLIHSMLTDCSIPLLLITKCFFKPEFVPGIHYYENSIFTVAVDDYSSLDTKHECLNSTLDTRYCQRLGFSNNTMIDPNVLYSTARG